ncbi:MAG: dihydropteroate synthase [Candidatus Melainabacteria bacterium]
MQAIFGILNITPDSFSDGGRLDSETRWLEHAQRLINGGATVLDVGGESTRPGAVAITAEEELSRVLPVIGSLRREFPGTPVSIDTRRAAVARAAVEAGAGWINDVSGGRFDPAMYPAVRQTGANYILMHSRGTPQTMQQDTRYPEGIVKGVIRELTMQLDAAWQAGVPSETLWIDPGFGFGKSATDNLTLMNQLGALNVLGHPILAGPSRKSFLAKAWGWPDIYPHDLQTLDRLTAWSLAICLAQGAKAVRVHNPSIIPSFTGDSSPVISPTNGSET